MCASKMFAPCFPIFRMNTVAQAQTDCFTSPGRRTQNCGCSGKVWMLSTIVCHQDVWQLLALIWAGQPGTQNGLCAKYHSDEWQCLHCLARTWSETLNMYEIQINPCLAQTAGMIKLSCTFRNDATLASLCQSIGLLPVSRTVAFCSMTTRTCRHIDIDILTGSSV
jgi:hypothetical protein